MTDVRRDSEIETYTPGFNPMEFIEQMIDVRDKIHKIVLRSATMDVPVRERVERAVELLAELIDQEAHRRSVEEQKALLERLRMPYDDQTSSEYNIVAHVFNAKLGQERKRLERV